VDDEVVGENKPEFDELAVEPETNVNTEIFLDSVQIEGQIPTQGTD
jgi:hypothetical protein